MHKTIKIQGRSLEISTTEEADAVLSSRALPLIVEMELLFDTLVSKRVKFLAQHNVKRMVSNDNETATDSKDEQNRATVCVNEMLSTRFRPVMMQCLSENKKQQCKLTDFPIVKMTPYIPKWLHIDFRFGHWFGEFGY